MGRITVEDRVTKFVDREGAMRKAEEAASRKIKEKALERAERREWSQRKYGHERG